MSKAFAPKGYVAVHKRFFYSRPLRCSQGTRLRKALLVETTMNTELAPDLNLSDFVTQVDDTYHALRAFNFLIDQMHETHAGGVDALIGYGIGQILRRHVDDLAEINSDVFRLITRVDRAEKALAEIEAAHVPALQGPAPSAEDRIAEIIRTAVLAEASRPAWHDLDMIAARACVDRADVARVMFVLTGEDHAGEAYRDGRGHPAEGMAAHLLALQINRALAHGEIWGRVSDATGLELDRLREVLEAVLTHLPRRAGYKGQIAEMQEAGRADADMREQAAERIAQGPSAEKLRETLEAVVGEDPETGGMSETIARIADESGLPSASVARVVGMLLAEVGEEPESAEEDPAPALRGRRKVH